MTSPSGNRLSIFPLRFRTPPQEFLLTSAAPRSKETLGEPILNLSGEIDLPITLETSHYLFTIRHTKLVTNECYVLTTSHVSLGTRNTSFNNN